MGRRDVRSAGPRLRALPPAARHYLHEDPEKQGSDPDLDGQFSHGAAGAAPAAAAAAAAGALGGSRSSASAGSPDPGRRGRRAPGRGRGREAGGGRREGAGGRRIGAQPKPPASGSGARGRRRDDSSRCSPPHGPAPSGRRLRDSPLPGAGRRLRAPGPRRALAVRRGEARGSPAAAAAAPARSSAPPPVGGPRAPRRGSARWVSVAAPLRLLARPASGSRLRSLVPWHTHARGQVVGERFGDSLRLWAALAPTVPAEQRSLPPVFCPSYIFPTWIPTPTPPPRPRKFPRDHSQSLLCA